MDCRRPMPSAPSWRPRPIIRWCASPTTRRATCSTPAPMITAPWAWRRAAPSCRPISTCRREWRRARVRWWWWPTAFRRTRLPYRLTRRPAPAFDSRAPVPRGEDMKMGRIIKLALFALCLAGVLPGAASAQGGATCPRPAARSEVTRPPDLYSSGGILNVTFNYFTDVDSVGRPLFCFMTPDGLQSPTLHVNPGETINLTVNNMVPPVPGGPSERMTNDGTICGDKDMTLTSVNVHFHGTNVSPKCHSDEVIRTMINSGQSFTYQIHIPANEPPGLYWYHPHIHGISAMALEGGATGVIEVEGIANIQPAVAGLPERYLVIRDQQIFATSLHRTQSPVTIPTWDLSLNYVPVSFPNYTPAIIKMQSGTQEFWRVANTSANTIIHLKLVYDGEDQPMQIVAFDGVPTGSQDGKHQGTIVTQKDILLAPASRAEFIVSAPPATVKSATLLTLPIDAGPAGDVTTLRPLAHIELSDAPVKIGHAAAPNGPPNLQRFAGLPAAKVAPARRNRAGRCAGEHPPRRRPQRSAQSAALRRARRCQGHGRAQALFLRVAGPRREGAHRAGEVLHHRRWKLPQSLRSQQSARHHHQPRRGGGMDHREPQLRGARFPHAPDPLPGAGGQRRQNPQGPAAVLRHFPGALLDRGGSLSLHQGEDGFPRRRGRGLRLSLPHPRS